MSRDATAFEVPNTDHPDARRPGAFAFLWIDGRHIGITHACPCGCGGLTALIFRGMRSPDSAVKDEWDVGGEWPKVTLSPSIGINHDCDGNAAPGHWHGFLENGVFVER